MSADPTRVDIAIPFGELAPAGCMDELRRARADARAHKEYNVYGMSRSAGAQMGGLVRKEITTVDDLGD
jgi:hypothetical protein